MYLVGRILYTLGYISAGPSARITRGGLLGIISYYRELDFHMAQILAVLQLISVTTCHLALMLIATYYAIKPLVV